MFPLSDCTSPEADIRGTLFRGATTSQIVRAERNLCDALRTDEDYSSASLIWLASPLNRHADAAGRELTFSIIG
jgi:hypothetical protein